MSASQEFKTSVQILDGGMGRQLARIGAPFRMPEWSALALIEAPDLVTEAHRQFIVGGAEIITTNSYSILPHQIGEAYFAANGRRLADLAGRLAREAAGSKVKAAYAGISELREDLEPKRYLDLVKSWIEAGAGIVGGCCGIGPEHIAEIAAFVRKPKQ